MRVILRENIENLGKKGDIVRVAAGYGRNYLIPKKMAVEITSTNAKMIAIEQAALQKGFEQEKSAYNELIQRLDQVSLSFVRKTSEKDVIFGSVSSTDIRDALEDMGFDIEKKKIILDEPIKRLGHYTVPVKVFHEERAEIKIEVVKEGEPVKELETEEALLPKDEKETAASEDESIAGVPAEKPAEAVPDEDGSKEVLPEEKSAESQGTGQEEKSEDVTEAEKQEEVLTEMPADKKEKEDKDKGE